MSNAMPQVNDFSSGDEIETVELSPESFKAELTEMLTNLARAFADNGFNAKSPQYIEARQAAEIFCLAMLSEIKRGQEAIRWTNYIQAMREALVESGAFALLGNNAFVDRMVRESAAIETDVVRRESMLGPKPTIKITLPEDIGEITVENFAETLAAYVRFYFRDLEAAIAKGEKVDAKILILAKMQELQRYCSAVLRQAGPRKPQFMRAMKIALITGAESHNSETLKGHLSRAHDAIIAEIDGPGVEAANLDENTDPVGQLAVDAARDVSGIINLARQPKEGSEETIN